MTGGITCFLRTRLEVGLCPPRFLPVIHSSFLGHWVKPGYHHASAHCLPPGHCPHAAAGAAAGPGLVALDWGRAINVLEVGAGSTLVLERIASLGELTALYLAGICAPFAGASLLVLGCPCLPFWGVPLLLPALPAIPVAPGSMLPMRNRCLICKPRAHHNCSCCHVPTTAANLWPHVCLCCDLIAACCRPRQLHRRAEGAPC